MLINGLQAIMQLHLEVTNNCSYSREKGVDALKSYLQGGISLD